MKKRNKCTHINKAKNVHGLYLAMKSAKLCNQIASKCNTQTSTLFTSQPWVRADVQTYHYRAGGSNHFYKPTIMGLEEVIISTNAVISPHLCCAGVIWVALLWWQIGLVIFPLTDPGKWTYEWMMRLCSQSCTQSNEIQIFTGHTSLKVRVGKCGQVSCYTLNMARTWSKVRKINKAFTFDKKKNVTFSL